MDHGANHRVLGVTRHGIASQHDDDTGNQVALGSAVALPAQPDTQQTGAPPDNSHGGVLQVIMHPWTSPAVFSESVDTSPSSNNHRVEEFLTAAGATQPKLTNEKEDGHHDSVTDKSASHDEMRQTLPQVIIATEAHGRDSTKEHLGPTHNGHNLANYPMSDDNKATDTSVESLVEV